MNLKRPFYKLPFALDTTLAQKELSELVSKDDWIDHASRFRGNFYLPLTTYQGTINNLKRTPIKKSHFANKLREVSNLLKSFDLTIGISRLMRLSPGHSVPVHSDTNEYWDDRVRLHIPLVTSERVFFSCGHEEVVMKSGEVWTFNNWIKHGVRNEGTEDRIHLVFDTKGSQLFDSNGELRSGRFEKTQTGELSLEKEDSKAIKSASEFKTSMQVVIKELEILNNFNEQKVKPWINLIEEHLKMWQIIEDECGSGLIAIPKYKEAIKIAFQEADKLGDSLRLIDNNVKVQALFKSRVQRGVNLQMLFDGRE